MKLWWENLSDRDRRAVVMIALACLLAFLWFGVWGPLQKENERGRQVLEQKAELVQWMRDASAQAKALAGANPSRGVAQAPTGSLLATVDRTVNQAQLKSAVKRIEPEGGNKVRVWMEDGSFDRLIRWLVGMQKNQAVAVEEIRVDTKSEDGTVNARITLLRGGQDA